MLLINRVVTVKTNLTYLDTELYQRQTYNILFTYVQQIFFFCYRNYNMKFFLFSKGFSTIIISNQQIGVFDWIQILIFLLSMLWCRTSMKTDTIRQFQTNKYFMTKELSLFLVQYSTVFIYSNITYNIVQ